jgi:GrpB-like predicted nucleotidyltransferase (UPF0157 family)
MEKVSRLEKYKLSNLGLERSVQVNLSLPSERWKRAFSDEAHLLLDQVRLEDLKLYHFGSTSIPSIAAKPILDILGSVGSLADFDAKKKFLEEIGYECKGEYGIPGRRFCVLYNPAKSHSYVHLHVFQHGDPALESNLVFRDYLRAHKSAAKEYEAEKLRLSQQTGSRSRYTEQKDPVIQKLLLEAKAWRKLPRSVVAILGSAVGGKNTQAYLQEEFPGAEVVNLNAVTVERYVYGEEARDDFPQMIEKIIAADLLVIATPVYWYAMSGPTKNFFDRFSNLLRGPHKHLGEALYGKKFILLSTGSDERLPFGYEVPFNLTGTYLGMDYLGAKYRTVKS